MPSIRTLAAFAAALALGLAGCGKKEDASAGNKARANAPLQTPKAEVEDKAAAEVAANDALKERLARQEAAAKLFDKGKPAPQPEPARPEPKAESARSAPTQAAAVPSRPAIEPPRANPPPPAATPSRPAIEPPRANVPPPAPAVAQAPAPQAEAPRVDVASARPATPPPTPSGIAAAKLITRVDPDFPREAVQAGVDKGLVKARMTLDANGNVTRVEVVEAAPRRIFDRAVVRSLSQWRFTEGPSGRTVETEIEFKGASKY